MRARTGRPDLRWAPLVTVSGVAMGAAALLAAWLDNTLAAVLATGLSTATACAWAWTSGAAPRPASLPESEWPADEEDSAGPSARPENEVPLWARQPHTDTPRVLH